tara:strand:- start:1398 stop:1949 length:552 start_codon:yes stop_codon:yes gene_type:complete
MKNSLFIYFAILLASGCGGIDLSDENELSRVLEEAVSRDDLMIKDIAGRTQLVRPVDNQPYVGWMVDHYENGRLRSLEYLREGVPSGLFRIWHPNGIPQSEGFFRDGMEDGVWTLWFENGKKREMKIFEKGALKGPYAWWHTNGQLRAEGTYENGKKEGIWIFYDKFGKEEKCLRYSDGELID